MPNSAIPGRWSGPAVQPHHHRSRVEATGELSRDTRQKWLQDATDSLIVGVLVVLVALIAFL